MAGTRSTINVDYDDSQISKAIQRLDWLASDKTPAMLEISEYLHERTRDHFDNEAAPDGTPWATLTDASLKRKQDQGVPVNKTLHGQTLHLRDTIFPFHSEDEAGVSTGPGTDAYAAAHQFGTEGMTINVPAHQRLISQAFGKALNFPVWANVSAYSFTGNLPARPYLGLSPEDIQEILGIIDDHIQVLLEKGG